MPLNSPLKEFVFVFWFLHSDDPFSAKKIKTELALPSPALKISPLIFGLIYPLTRSYRGMKIQQNISFLGTILMVTRSFKIFSASFFRTRKNGPQLSLAALSFVAEQAGMVNIIHTPPFSPTTRLKPSSKSSVVQFF